MPILDDEHFETYLKQFRPLVPKPLPPKTRGYRARRVVLLWASGVIAVGIVVGMLITHLHNERARVTQTSIVGSSNRFSDAQPLTMRAANALMAKARSFKALINEMAFRPQTIPLPKGKQSAVAVLGKERLKL